MCELADLLIQRREHQRTEAEVRMDCYRAFLVQAEALLSRIEGWLGPLQAQQLLSFRRHTLWRDDLVRPESIVGLEVSLSGATLGFTPSSPKQAGVAGGLAPWEQPIPRLCITVAPLSPTGPDLKLVPDADGEWRVGTNGAVRSSPNL